MPCWLQWYLSRTFNSSIVNGAANISFVQKSRACALMKIFPEFELSLSASPQLNRISYNYTRSYSFDNFISGSVIMERWLYLQWDHAQSLEWSHKAVHWRPELYTQRKEKKKNANKNAHNYIPVLPRTATILTNGFRLKASLHTLSKVWIIVTLQQWRSSTTISVSWD